MGNVKFVDMTDTIFNMWNNAVNRLKESDDEILIEYGIMLEENPWKDVFTNRHGELWYPMIAEIRREKILRGEIKTDYDEERMW